MRIAVSQINPILGNFSYNADKIIQFSKQALDKNCDLVVFPECALFGYHPFDLLERKKIVLQQEIAFKNLLKKLPKNIHVLFGLFTTNKSKKGRPYYNSAVLIYNGKVIKSFHKQLLPTGDVFDEARFIEPGNLEKNYFNIKGKKFFLTICEDMWAWPDKFGNSLYSKNPIQSVKKQKIDLVLNLSASPWYKGKEIQRKYMVQKTAEFFKAPMMYVNLVGGQDEIVFDGSSFVCNQKGQILLTCQSFEEDFNIFDLSTQTSWSQAPQIHSDEQLRRCLMLGIRDFSKKTGIKKVHLGSSGGIDSAVVACLAADALGPQNVTTIALPGPFSSPDSERLASALAKNLNVGFLKLNISDAYQTTLNDIIAAYGLSGFSVVNENLQARLRGLFLMAYSNKENSLLLTTGNKSEYSTGYATLYGDMCGGLAPIADLTKNQVYRLAKLYNQDYELIPSQIIDRAPSAELRPNQKDQDSLPEYDLLDQSVASIVENTNPAKTLTDKWLLEKLMATEFKRWQSAPIIKCSKHAFGRGRRFPVAHQAKEN